MRQVRVVKLADQVHGRHELEYFTSLLLDPQFDLARCEGELLDPSNTVKPPCPYLVLVTAPDLKTARGLAQSALKSKLAACVNLVPRLESHYWWHNKIESGAEVLMLFKTTRTCLSQLQKLVLEKHPYDNPEFVAFKMNSGSPAYLNWIVSSVAERVELHQSMEATIHRKSR